MSDIYIGISSHRCQTVQIFKSLEKVLIFDDPFGFYRAPPSGKQTTVQYHRGQTINWRQQQTLRLPQLPILHLLPLCLLQGRHTLTSISPSLTHLLPTWGFLFQAIRDYLFLQWRWLPPAVVAGALTHVSCTSHHLSSPSPPEETRISLPFIPSASTSNTILWHFCHHQHDPTNNHIFPSLPPSTFHGDH